MDNIIFIICNNPRLDFKNSVEKVSEFITKRLNFYGIRSIHFIDKDNLSACIKSLRNKEQYIVVQDIMNPVIDFELIQYALSTLQKINNKVVKVVGAIPGTQFDYMLAPMVEDFSVPPLVLNYSSQDKYNNQFNLYKFKRLKMFLTLWDISSNIHTYNIDEFIEDLSKKEVFEKLIAFGEDILLTTYDDCPHCGCEIIGLELKASQPVIGYLPASKLIYHKCIKCGLIVMSPHLNYENIYKCYCDFDKQDYISSTLVTYHANSSRCDFSKFIEKLPQTANCIDLGGGTGKFSKYLKNTYPHWEVTHSDFGVRQSRELEDLSIHTKTLNILEESIGESEYDLITAWELVEHIPYHKFKFAITNIYNALKPNGIFVFSTPDVDSPLCQMFDFFAFAPPFHYLVLGRKWLTEYFQQNNAWNILSAKSSSDFLEESDAWLDYSINATPSFQLRATAEVLKVLMQSEENKKLLLDNNMGTEIIMAIQKK